jgi:DNA-directed RNA polymerase specialized sigma24 family protein
MDLARNDRSQAGRSTRTRQTTVVRSAAGLAAWESAGWRQVGRVLDGEIDRLPEPYHGVLVVCGLEGRRLRDAARQLCCQPAQVRQRLTAALRLLQRRLMRRGLPVSVRNLFDFLVQEAKRSVLPDRLARAAARLGVC